MKRTFSLSLRISFVTLALLFLMAEATVPGRAWWLWVDQLGDCSASAISIGNSINQELANNEITQQQWNNLQDQNMQQMQNCITQINVLTQEPDFCDAARAARDMCVSQYYGLGLEFWEARSTCIMSSGINSCE